MRQGKAVKCICNQYEGEVGYVENIFKKIIHRFPKCSKTCKNHNRLIARKTHINCISPNNLIAGNNTKINIKGIQLK